jgi:predicted cupin superfamily sugar epimerase
MPSAQDIINKLGLVAHPEGGYYKETYRSAISVHSNQANDTRSAITCIYFLLTKGQKSRFHQVKHDEVWHFYLGSPLRLIDIDRQNLSLTEHILGNYSHDLCAQQVICANHWQAAETLGEYSLLGCSVAPGFDFADFSFLSEHNDQIIIKQQYPHLHKFI